jgi:hypothetical protein
MKTKTIFTTLILFLSALFSYAPLKAQLVIDAEGGAVFTGYNDEVYNFSLFNYAAIGAFITF